MPDIERAEACATAYFITFNTYGSRLHGCQRGSVDRLHNIPGTPQIKADKYWFNEDLYDQKYQKFMLNSKAREIVKNSIKSTSEYYDWWLFAVHARTNHVHVVLRAMDLPIGTVMGRLKTYATRELNKHPELRVEKNKYWSRHGSTRYILEWEGIFETIEYVIDRQGERMSCYYDDVYKRPGSNRGDKNMQLHENLKEYYQLMRGQE